MAELEVLTVFTLTPGWGSTFWHNLSPFTSFLLCIMVANNAVVVTSGRERVKRDGWRYGDEGEEEDLITLPKQINKSMFSSQGLELK